MPIYRSEVGELWPWHPWRLQPFSLSRFQIFWGNFAKRKWWKRDFRWMKKTTGWFGYIGDEMVPIYIGILSQTMIFGSVLNNQDFPSKAKGPRFFFSWLMMMDFCCQVEMLKMASQTLGAGDFGHGGDFLGSKKGLFRSCSNMEFGWYKIGEICCSGLGWQTFYWCQPPKYFCFHHHIPLQICSPTIFGNKASVLMTHFT